MYTQDVRSTADLVPLAWRYVLKLIYILYYSSNLSDLFLFVAMVEYVKDVWRLTLVIWAMWERLQSMKRNGVIVVVVVNVIWSVLSL